MSFEIEGRKIFFINPPPVLREDSLDLILKNEYEVYIVDDYKKINLLFSKFEGCIVFINIDIGLKENEWIDFIQDILGKSETKDAKIGILTMSGSKQLAETYLMKIGVPCGFITMKLGVAEMVKLILKVLEANEARGRRKFVRAKCTDGSSTFNATFNGNLRQGHVIDVSIAGMACSFDKDLDIPLKHVFEDIQIQFKGTRVLTKGILAGIREENGTKVHVILFDKNIEPRSKEKLHQIIHNCLQREIEKVIN